MMTSIQHNVGERAFLILLFSIRIKYIFCIQTHNTIKSTLYEYAGLKIPNKIVWTCDYSYEALKPPFLKVKLYNIITNANLNKYI